MTTMIVTMRVTMIMAKANAIIKVITTRMTKTIVTTTETTDDEDP